MSVAEKGDDSATDMNPYEPPGEPQNEPDRPPSEISGPIRDGVFEIFVMIGFIALFVAAVSALAALLSAST